ncbi:MAG: hypothetical protein Kow00121_30650 [Elainellaceae cyanobacterium]
MSINLPDRIYSALERWARREGRTTASQAAFVVERAVLDAEERGEIPEDFPPDLNCNSIDELVTRYWDRLIDYRRIPLERLRLLHSGNDTPTELETARIALCLGVAEEEIETIVQRSSNRKQ